MNSLSLFRLLALRGGAGGPANDNTMTAEERREMYPIGRGGAPSKSVKQVHLRVNLILTRETRKV